MSLLGLLCVLIRRLLSAWEGRDSGWGLNGLSGRAKLGLAWQFECAHFSSQCVNSSVTAALIKLVSSKKGSERGSNGAKRLLDQIKRDFKYMRLTWRKMPKAYVNVNSINTVPT